MIWKTLAITLAFVTAGTPWAKDDTPVTPEPEPAVIQEAAEASEETVPELMPVMEYAEPEPVPEPVEFVADNNKPPVVEAEPEWTNSGTFTITHYCPCSRCCGKWAGGPTASGVMPTAGRTVAVDKSVIPLGSEVLINGNVYIAEDTGVKGNHIDIFCTGHQEALNRGMYSANVSWR